MNQVFLYWSTLITSIIESKPVRFDEWSSWSSCDVTCGDTATQQRTRGCWTNCSRPLKEIRKCALASCPGMRLFLCDNNSEIERLGLILRDIK